MLDLDPDPGDKNNVDPCESGLALDYALLKTYLPNLLIKKDYAKKL